MFCCIFQMMVLVFQRVNYHVYLKRDLREQTDEVMQNLPESVCICVGSSVIRCVCLFRRILPVDREQLCRLPSQKIQDCF